MSPDSAGLNSLILVGVKFPDGKTRILPAMPEQVEQAVLKVQEDAAEFTSIHNI